ncbi:T9SS type A sorting domain-containing protein [Fluviicola taffensis]|uniref:T9SS type A sorting domain-containing protein n=1 Tax=Fluviicola taffensis TaxID=191579 RepID=UPI0031377EE7
MKKLLFLSVLLLSIAKVQGQTYDWSSDMPADPYVSGGQVKSIMYQGKLYHFSDSIGNYIRVTMYNPEVGTWRWLTSENTYISGLSRIEGEVIGNKAYLVTGGIGGLYAHKFDFNTNTIVGYNSLIATGGLGTWEFKADPVSGKVIVMFVENTNTSICTFNTTTNVWDTEFGVNTLLDPGFSGAGNFIISFSSTSIYYGISGAGNNRLAVAPINAPYALTYYNSGGANDGRLKNDLGTNFVTGNFFLVGNGQSTPMIYMRNYTDQKTYEKTFSGTNNVQLNSVTDPSLSFNIDTVRFAVNQNASYAFILSNFTAAGNGSLGNSYVFRKDLGAGTWDTLGIQIPLTAGLNNLFMLSLDQSGEHLAINYQNDGYYYYKVYNTKPEINPSSIVPTTGTCSNHQNLIYHALEFYDDNKDGPLKILNLADGSGAITGMTAELIYFDNTSSPSVTKYAIYGFIGTGGNSSVVMQLFDGYSITNVTLPTITVGQTAAPVVSFASNPLTLCSNDNLIDLSNYVNYYDHGTFKINGVPVVGTTIDGTVVSQGFTGGSISLDDEINGCIVNTSGSLTFPILGSATVSSTPSACGSTSGTATVSFTAGASANYAVEWSTGENATTISNLAPGPYFYNVTDDYNCHITGATTVNATGITLTPTITNVSCNGLNDGSITINIVNPNSYQFVWSNGYGTQTISNLAPGNYSINVWDNTGCQASGSYTITEPAPITGNLFGFEPTCGATDGGIFASISASAPVYDWIGTGQTTQNLSNVGHGLYTLKVTDGNGCIKQFNYQLDDHNAVDITTTVLNTDCNQNNGGITTTFVQDPNGGGAASSWSWSNGETTQSIFNLAEGSYTITVLNGPSNQPCYSSKTVQVGTRAPLSQPICLVTVDTSTTTNLVVWQRTETSGIDHYNIYRESNLAGNYQLIDTVMATNLSYFNDVVASPMDRSWRYKLSAVNACGTEGPISTEHKTLHLNTILNAGNGSFDILWDDYEGSGNVAGYVVWRKTDQVDWMPVSSTIALGTSFYNDVPLAGSTGVDYYIEMLTNSPCIAEKAQDFNTTRSNRERGQFAAGDGVDGASSNGIDENYLNEIEMYPNPTQGNVTFVQTNNEKITYRVTSLSGQVITTLSSSDSKIEMQLEGIQSGIYLVEISSANSKITKRISKY